MKISKNLEGSRLTIALSGRLDTMTAPELEKVINENIAGVETLVLDLKELEYMSSAGLRVLLSAEKKMRAVGKMTVKNVNDMIMEIFEVTGFSDILTIE